MLLSARSQLTFLFVVLWAVVTSPPLWLLAGLKQLLPNLETLWGFLALIYTCLWIAASGWLGLRTAHYVFKENRLFLEAVRQTANDFKMYLGSLPVVGSHASSALDDARESEDAVRRKAQAGDADS